MGNQQSLHISFLWLENHHLEILIYFTFFPFPYIQPFELCKGVAHCHGHCVLHRDLKPQNLLVDKEKGILKIANLGLGRAFRVPLKSYTHEVPIAFLERVKEDFTKKYGGGKAATSVANSLNK
ncbi:hypothetical protein L6452_25399 [Arctium lappa]|uniref:Uncharacterized protein n=1 Tax=Arctium lappa TaxID=4217 RepID=A0ACB9ABB6_ARCLA|nr:hypothetical protein L6452_25399 [Arctium lappa]